MAAETLVAAGAVPVVGDGQTPRELKGRLGMPTVLVVDDTAVDRTLAGRLLEKSPGMHALYADSGRQALQLLETECPDVVVTDLQMPEMDGFQLLTAIQQTHGEIPVVLMTAHGSEDIASQALEHGAASFVPKAELADLLVDTVRQILALSGAEPQYSRLVAGTRLATFEFELENDVELIEPLVDWLQQIATSLGLVAGTRRLRLGVALEHALHNAMFRGNLEMPRGESAVPDPTVLRQRLSDPHYAGRRVHVQAMLSRTEAHFTITDQGPGFDTAQVPQAGSLASWTHPGRGLILMTSFFDEVQFNAAGNQVTLLHKAVVGALVADQH